jgi:hypothetical protein
MVNNPTKGVDDNMNVYELSVRKLQRVQVKEYEPAEAEVTIKAQLEPGEDYHAAMSKLVDDASIGVREALGLSPSGKLVLEKAVKPVSAAAVNPKPPVKVADDDFGEDTPKAAAPVKAEAPAEAPKRRGRPPKAKPVEDDFGDDTPAPKTTTDDDFGDEAPAPKKAAADDDFGDDAPAKPAPAPKAEKPVKREDVEEDNRKWIMEQVTSKKVSAADVRLLVHSKFNATTMKEVPDEYIGALREEVQLLIDANEV